MRGTQILVGNTSKDKRISLFLVNRNITSQDGGKWTVLEGMVQTAKTNLTPFVEAECTFHFKSTIGITHEKVVYSEMRIPEEIESDDSDKFKYRFSFDFGTKALPPTFLFDPSEWSSGQLFGVTWTVYGFLATVVHHGLLTRHNIHIESSAQAPFQVGYRYTEKLLYSMPDLGQIVSSSGKRFLLFTRNTDVQVKARLLNPICKQPNRRIHLQLEFINYLSSHHVQEIMVELKQKITLQLHSGQQFKFKKSMVLHNEQPAPLYDGDLDNLFKHDIVIDQALDELNQSYFAKTYPLFWKPEDGTDLGDLVPSTVFQTLEPGMICMSCEYKLKVNTNVIDMNSGTVSENTLMIPIVFSSTDAQASPRTLTVGGTFISNESFLPILSNLIEDLNHTCSGLDSLIVDWRTYRRESARGEKMVTESADHAIFLLEILESFYAHLQVFMDHIVHKTSQHRVPWTADSIPFNMFLLELELLIRACPSAPAYSSLLPKKSAVANLLTTSRDFIYHSRTVVMAWIKPFTGDAKEICSLLKKEYQKVHNELQNIADGNDHDWGQEKPDPELVEGLRLSLLESSSRA